MTQNPAKARREGRQNKFSNYRDWRSFLSHAEVPPAYASVATALKAGHAWLSGRGWSGNAPSERKSPYCQWLLGSAGLISGARDTLGV